MNPLYLRIEENVRWKPRSASPVATGQSARRCRPIPLRQQPWVSLGSSPLSRTTEQSLDHDRTNKAGYRDEDYLWSGYFKASLDACIEPGSIRGSFDNDGAGIAALAAFCRQHQAELVVMEATGGYERKAFLSLWAQGLPCAVTNARNVRQYAEAMGVLEKTDRIDASIIARFARAKDLQPTPLPGAAQLRLKALVARLRQVTDDLTVQKQRRSSLLDNAEMLASIDEVIVLLKRQSRTLEGEIGSMIDDDPLWAHLAQAWRSVKGVAGRTVARLMADLPEIGTYSNKAIASLSALP